MMSSSSTNHPENERSTAPWINRATSSLTVVLAAMLSAALVIVFDIIAAESPDTGLATLLSGVVIGHWAVTSLACAVGGLVVLTGCRLTSRFSNRAAVVAGRWVFILLPFAWFISRTARLLFTGRAARQHEMGGLAPVLATLAIAGATILGAEALRFLTAVKPGRTQRLLLLTSAMLAAALGLRYADGAYHRDRYIYIHQLMAVAMLSLPMVIIVMWAAHCRQRTANDAPKLRPLALPITLLLLLTSASAWHVLSFYERPSRDRLVASQDLLTSSRLTALIPFSRPAPRVRRATGLSERRSRTEALRVQALDQLSRTPSPSGPKNLLLLSVDAIRSDHSSFIDYRRPTTPFLEELARTSYVFSRAYAPSTNSFYSITSILSGSSPATLQKLAGKNPILLSSHLQELGYHATALFPRVIFAVRPPDWPPPDASLGFKRVVDMSHARQMVGRIIDMMDDVTYPFFIYTHMMDPHAPYDPTAGPEFGDENIDKYDTEIAVVDGQIRRLWSAMTERGLDSDTVLAVIADHGEAFGEHGVFQHGGLPYEEQSRVPLLLHVPWLPGGRVDAPVNLVSLCSTLTDLLSLPGGPDSEGPSLLPLMLGLDDGSESYAVVECPPRSSAAGSRYPVTVMHGRFKILMDLNFQTARLFDLDADPGEREDLARARPDVTNRLTELYAEWDSDRLALGESRRQARSGDAFPPRYQQLRDEISAHMFRRLDQFVEFLTHEDVLVRRDALGILFDSIIAGQAPVSIDPEKYADPHEQDETMLLLLGALRFAKGREPLPDAVLTSFAEMDAETRTRLARALGLAAERLPDPTILRSLLEREDAPGPRLELLIAAGRAQDPSVIDELQQAALKDDPIALIRILEALLAFSDEVLGDRLRALLIDSPAWAVRARALERIGCRDTPFRRAHVQHALRDTSIGMRVAAYRAIQGFDDVQFKQRLLSLIVRLEDDSQVRIGATRALIALESEDRLDPVLEALGAHADSADAIAALLFSRCKREYSSKSGVLKRDRIPLSSKEPLRLDPNWLSGIEASALRIALRIHLHGAAKTASTVTLRSGAGKVLARMECSPGDSIHVFDVDRAVIPEDALELTVESPGTGEATTRLLGAIVVGIEDPLAFHPPGFAVADRPFLPIQLSRGWRTSIADAERCFLTTKTGSFHFMGSAESPAALSVTLDVAAARLSLTLSLNGRSLGTHDLAEGTGREVVVALPESSYAPGEKNVLTFECKATRPARRKEWLWACVALRAIEWQPGLPAENIGERASRSIVGLDAMTADLVAWSEGFGGQEDYSFAVAGHVYGRHEPATTGLFAPFRQALARNSEDREMAFLVLTGDIVMKRTRSSFDAIDADLAELGLPVFCAPGNHDAPPPNGPHSDLFTKRYGARRCAFWIGRDAFLICDTVAGGGNLAEADLKALREALARKPRALFIFTHHLVWIDKSRSAKDPNLKAMVNGIGAGYAENGTFWSEVLPLLADHAGPSFVIAGDVGAGSRVTESFEEASPSVFLLTSGMGDHPDVGTYLRFRISSEGVHMRAHHLATTRKRHLPGVLRIPTRVFSF